MHSRDKEKTVKVGYVHFIYSDPHDGLVEEESEKYGDCIFGQGLFPVQLTPEGVAVVQGKEASREARRAKKFAGTGAIVRDSTSKNSTANWTNVDSRPTAPKTRISRLTAMASLLFGRIANDVPWPAFDLFKNTGNVLSEYADPQHERTADDQEQQNDSGETICRCTGELHVECLNCKHNGKECKDNTGYGNEMEDGGREAGNGSESKFQ